MTDSVQDVYTLQIRRHSNPNSASPYCEACKNGFLHVNSIQVRQFTQTGKLPGVCKSCNIAFLKICRLQIRHLTQNEHQPHLCNKCGKSFTHAGNHRKHMLLHEKNGDNLPEGQQNGKMPATRPDPPYKCEKCDRNFLKYGSFIKHYANHDKKFVCEICEKVFKTKLLLKGHQYSHRIEPTAHVCKLCKITFAVPEELEEHLVKHVTDQIQSVKEQGEQMQNVINPEDQSNNVDMQAKDQADDLKESKESPQTVKEPDNPVKSDHNPEKEDNRGFKHCCSICQKGFVNLGALKNHFSVHTGDLAYECKKCKRKFMHAFNLKKHAKTHLRNPYCCKTCNKVFKSYRQFKTHSLVHRKKK